MNEHIENEIEKVVVELTKAGKSGPREAKLNPMDFWEMVNRLHAKVHPPRSEYVILNINGREVRVEPDAETPRGHVDINSEALKETP